jgi:hypothetical protein
MKTANLFLKKIIMPGINPQVFEKIATVLIQIISLILTNLALLANG